MFFQKKNIELGYEETISSEKSNFWQNCQIYLRRYSDTFLTDIKGIFDGAVMDTDDLIDIIRCLYKVPLGTMRLFT